MKLDEALDIVIGRTGVERYRFLCSSENRLPAPNDSETWRKWVLKESAKDPWEVLPDISAHLAEASIQPRQVKPCGGCPG